VDPFKLLFRILLAFFRIFGYFLAFMAHTLWCVLHGHPEMAGDAMGDLGRGITDALADVFKN
jgi:hypothetical protein